MKTNLGEDTVGAALKDKIRNFYDIGSPLYLEVYGENIHDGYYITGKETRQEAQENLIKVIAEKAKIKARSKVLDVGCGVGGSAIWLAEHLEAATTGITISPVQVEIARKLAQSRGVNSTFLVMNAENMQFTDPFDVLWVVGSSTHFQSQENFVKSASSLLKKNGKFVVFDWMVDEAIANVEEDPNLKRVTGAFLLASVCSINTYLKWFMEAGYRITYAEDITDHTYKTWDDSLSVLHDPSTWKVISKIPRESLPEIIPFLESLGKMKLAMKEGKLKSGIIVAEKI
jgi:tocopherol O-methyltransferase